MQQVFVELKARFDEANNIRWSKIMVDAGVKIIYSIPKIKVHSKIALVKRKTADGVKGYGYIGTGNFNETTARFYTDHALFTTRQEAIKDLSHLFNILGEEKGPQKNAAAEFHHLLVSQYNMINVFEKEINEQIKRKAKGREALIRIKINNLEDTYMIDLLYKAAKAGVHVHLLVRGICCIVPGRENLSETIQVKRIIDRFLEHSRIFIFGSGDDTKIYIGSADWMTRNLQHRIEVCVPILDSILKDDLISYFGIQWSDTVKAVSLDEELRSFKTNDLEQAGQPGPQEKIYRYLKSRS